MMINFGPMMNPQAEDFPHPASCPPAFLVKMTQFSIRNSQFSIYFR